MTQFCIVITQWWHRAMTSQRHLATNRPSFSNFPWKLVGNTGWTWDSKPQPLGYKSNSLSIRPRLPCVLYVQVCKTDKWEKCICANKNTWTRAVSFICFFYLNIIIDSQQSCIVSLRCIICTTTEMNHHFSLQWLSCVPQYFANWQHLKPGKSNFKPQYSCK